MKNILIWWHRRRAVWHHAMGDKHRANGQYGDMRFHYCYGEWHQAQIGRISKPTN